MGNSFAGVVVAIGDAALKPIIDLMIKHDIQIPIEDTISLELDAMKKAVDRVASHRVRGRIAIKLSATSGT